MSDLVSKYNWLKSENEAGIFFTLHCGDKSMIQLHKSFHSPLWQVRAWYGCICIPINKIPPTEDANQLVKTVEKWYKKTIVNSEEN